MLQFELFERKSRPTSTVPTIGVQTRGTMSINAAAFDLLVKTGTRSSKHPVAPSKRSGKQTAKASDGADAMIEFMYDKKEQVVGLRLAPPDSMNSYPVRKQPQAESYLVTAKAFLTYYEIPTDKMRRYKASLIEGSVLAFSLKEDAL